MARDSYNCRPGDDHRTEQVGVVDDDVGPLGRSGGSEVEPLAVDVTAVGYLARISGAGRSIAHRATDTAKSTDRNIDRSHKPASPSRCRKMRSSSSTASVEAVHRGPDNRPVCSQHRREFVGEGCLAGPVHVVHRDPQPAVGMQPGDPSG